MRLAEPPPEPCPPMAALSERKIEIVRALVQAAPDKVVGGLQAALAETGASSALAGVRRLVDAEADGRRLRNAVLQPLAPMCRGDGRAADALTFPYRVLPLIWRGLQETDPGNVKAAEQAYLIWSPPEPPPEVFDALLQRAIAGLKDRSSPEFAEAAQLADAARPRGAELLIACAQMGPVVRSATLRLTEWLTRFDEASAAAARLAYKDAVTVCEDGGPQFFEMLAAQMAQPWMVMRIICEVMDKPTERYLADSEMAFFGERVMAEIDAALKAIAKIELDGGPAAGIAAAKLAELVTHQTHELETCVDLSKAHGWGQRIAKQRLALASTVEGRLKDAERQTKEALPTQPSKVARVRRLIPRLSHPPDMRQVGRAITLLTFAQEVRSSANYGGFASARGKLVETLSGHIDNYVEEVLDLIKTGDAESEEAAYAFLEVCAQLNGLVQGEKSAALIRRRAHAMSNPDIAVEA
jgi:hypothetical protein